VVGGTVRSVAWAILWFVFSLLPVIFFKDRLLMYYGYQGTAALSLAAAGVARIATGRLAAQAAGWTRQRVDRRAFARAA
jgi:hypothetical protein